MTALLDLDDTFSLLTYEATSSLLREYDTSEDCSKIVPVQICITNTGTTIKKSDGPMSIKVISVTEKTVFVSIQGQDCVLRLVVC